MNKRKRKNRILFRTEASPAAGMGHLVRCVSLANMLKTNYDISFLLSNHSPQIDQLIKTEGFSCQYLKDGAEIRENGMYDESDIVVLDGYNFKSEMQKEIKKKGKGLIFIDDLHDQHFYADAIINVSDSVSVKNYLAEPYTHFFLGSKYALLRNEFIEAALRPAREINSVNELFISMGGSDSGNITLKIIKAAQHISSIKTIHAVIGAVNAHEQELDEHIKNNKTSIKITLHKNINSKQMSSVLNECELAICPASGTCMEAAAVGIGMITGYTADNQLGILNGLIEKQCATSIGDFYKANSESISEVIIKCITNLEIINSQIKNQKKLVDGLSPQRINNIFNELFNEN